MSSEIQRAFDAGVRQTTMEDRESGEAQSAAHWDGVKLFSILLLCGFALVGVGFLVYTKAGSGTGTGRKSD